MHSLFEAPEPARRDKLSEFFGWFQEDTGVAIGADGRNIRLARELARRHFDIDDVELA